MVAASRRDRGRNPHQRQDVTHLRPNKRAIGMVFQSYALFPNDGAQHRLRPQGRAQAAAELKVRVDEMLAMIKLPQLAERYPYQLSGGAAACLARPRARASPQILLLDEPLSALTRASACRCARKSARFNASWHHHDLRHPRPGEALSMSIASCDERRRDRAGRDAERDLQRAVSRFVASFVGTLNLLNGRIVDASSGAIDIDGSARPRAQTQRAKPATFCDALRPSAAHRRRGDDRNTLAASSRTSLSRRGRPVRVRLRRPPSSSTRSIRPNDLPALGARSRSISAATT